MWHLYYNHQWNSILNAQLSQVTAMRTHLQHRRHSSGSFLTALLLLTFSVATTFASPSGHITGFGQLFSTDPNNATFTPLCDDAQLRSVTQQVAYLKISIKNIFLLLDAYNLRLDYIKMLLDERLPEVRTKPYWIDVRGGAGGSGESVSSTHASTGSILFPSLSTQSSASGAIVRSTSSHSSSGGIDLSVNSTQSTDLVSFMGGAYLPVLETHSSESVANLSSLSTDAPLSCNCNP